MSTIDPRLVLVPYDFSELGRGALEVARQYRDRGARVRVVHVIPLLIPSDPGMMWEDVDDAERIRLAREQVHAACVAADLGDAECTVLLGGMGNPAIEVVELAADCGAELVIVPSHGRTGLARLALGSVAERIVRHAPCPVLVLRGPALP